MVKIFKTRKEIWVLLAFTLPFVYLSGKYFLSSNIKIYDASGHTAAVWYLKEYLWPNFSGWNHLNLLGYDQGLLYPVLFHYISATLAFIFGVEQSVKLVLGLGLIAVPASTYFLISSFFTKQKERVFVVSFILLAFTVFPAYWGSDLKALTDLGLLPSFISLPILFFYLGSLPKLDKEKFLFPTLLLAAVLLTHIVAGLVALLCLVVFIGVKIKFNEINKSYFLHAFLTLLITSFFWLPFLLSSPFLSTSVHVSSMGTLNFMCLLLAGFFIFIFYKTKKIFLLTLATAVFFLALATSIDYLVERFTNSGFIYDKIYALHIYRYQIYEYLLLILLIFYYPAQLLFSLKKPRVKSELVAFLPFLVLIFILLFRTDNYFSNGEVEVRQVNASQGRFLETFSRAQTYPFVYTSQNQLVEKNQPWAYGLFTDANPNGPYLGSLIRSLYAERTKATSGYFTETKIIDWERIPSYINLFAIENLEYIDYSKPAANSNFNFFTLKVKNQKLVEIPILKVETVSKNWGSAVNNWWVEKGKLSKLLAYDPSNKLTVKTGQNAQVELKSHNKNYSNFEISVNGAKDAVPVLVKFSYFPGWVAYENGKKIPIYPASPNLMLVLARDNVRFVYERTWYQTFTMVVSFVTLLSIIIYEIKKIAKSKKK